ncbi:SPOR domain-containing protein [Pelistega europaea]|uniref:SPOR domain-containing protein n=1 Tax=Pelistega europaea TaxID=106147 RepID=A0A7Y4P591_9BURK|nr:SPOR domain-containing protein [Pelistega europaea]NOL48614.1 SPOR domain-containing protein [Pelistega europaea]
MARKTSSQQNAPSPLGYIIFGIVIGLGIAAAGAYYFRTRLSTPPTVATEPTKPVTPLATPTAPVTPTPATPAPAAATPVSPTAPVAAVVTPAPVVQATPPQPNTPVVSQQAKPKQNKTEPDRIGALIHDINKSEASKNYIPTYLQVGAFKNSEEANAKRAQLLLQGFTNITIVKSKVDNADFFRVRLGPFASDKALKEAQEQLKANSINSTPTR